MLDREDVAEWIGRYIAAWDSNDPAEVRDLFDPDATYRYRPWEGPHRGHDRITAAWLDGADSAGDHLFSWEVVAVDGDTAVVQGRTEYIGGEAAGRTYDNLWVIRYSGAGRAAAFTEWFMERPAG